MRDRNPPAVSDWASKRARTLYPEETLFSRSRCDAMQTRELVLYVGLGAFALVGVLALLWAWYRHRKEQERIWGPAADR
jgi:hypothetical protein